MTVQARLTMATSKANHVANKSHSNEANDDNASEANRVYDIYFCSTL